MKKVKMFVLLALSLCITLFATSCSEDETSQVSFTSLNMLDENHGKTLLGETGVYINGSINFRSDSWQVVDLGISSSFPSKTMPNLDNLSNETSVLPNHRYACCNTENVLTFLITAKPKAHAFKNEMCFPLTKTKCELKKHPNSKFECFFNDFNRTKTSLFLFFPSKQIQDNLVCVLELQE